MTSAPTVLEEPRSTRWAMPAFVGAVCVLAVASSARHGLPSDIQTRAASAVFAAGAVASAIWLFRWRRIRLATLAIDHAAIAMQPRGPRPQPRTIVRRPDSRLTIVRSHAGLGAGNTVTVHVLYDAAVGDPRISIDVFGGVDRVRRACLDHGWVFADPVLSSE